MSDPVKRPYRSERRKAQAEETRRRVLGAAASLFEERGYAGTTIVAVAESAGVSPETIYARFGSKRTLLGELLQSQVRGSDTRPVTEQDAPRALAALTDQREQLGLFADDVSARLERAAPLVVVVGAAARSDPELGTLLERLHGDRRGNLATLVDALGQNGPLRLPPGQALDTVWALTTPELHQTLTRVGGWTRLRYRSWLAATLASTLLVDPEPRPQ